MNTFGPNGLLARHTSAGSLFYAFDTQGSVAQKLDAAGNVLSSSMFDAFGAATTTAVATDPFTYGAQSGYYTDTETGLLLLGQRYYDPGTGRLLTRDPMGSDGGINLYAYVANNPVDGSDPSGFIPQTTNCKEPLNGQINKMLRKICAGLKRTPENQLGGGTVDATCMKKWCSRGTVHCKSSGACASTSTCASSYGGPDGGLKPGATNQIWICDDYLNRPSCKKKGLCKSILHEVAGDCGSSHSPQGPGYPQGYSDEPNPTDPCEKYAIKLCKKLGL